MFTDNETHLALWFPILTGLSTTISHSNIDVRTTALTSLFEILKYHGNKFEANLWRLIFRGVLSPMFDTVRHADSYLQKEENEWLKHTCLPALDSLIKLFTLFFDSIFFLLPDALSLLSSCVLQDNQDLARIGATCFLQFVMKNGQRLSLDQWTLICDKLAHMIRENAPADLLPDQEEKSKASIQKQRAPVRVIQGKCAVQLGLLEALKDITFQFYGSIETSHLVTLLDALEHNYSWTSATRTLPSMISTVARLGIGELSTLVLFFTQKPHLILSHDLFVSIFSNKTRKF